MKHFTRILIFLFVALLGVSSCGDEPDGKWAKMKWTNVNNLMNVGGVYILPDDGGSFSFLCRNYEHPWIESVTVNGVQYSANEDRLAYNGEWFTVKFEGNNMIVTAQPMPANLDSRGFNIQVTAGDIFDNIVFSQQRNMY